MMDGLSELLLGNECLKSSLHELIGCKSEDIIELSLFIVEETELDNSSNKGVTLKESSWIVFVKSHELSCSLSEFSQGQLDSPNFSLVLEAVSTNKFKLIKKSFLVEWLSRGLGCFLVVCV